MGEFYNWLIDALGLDKAEFSPADHAVAVTGIDLSDPSNPMVILNESGSPDGAGVRYPLDRFMDAWDNSDCYYVATDGTPTQDLGQFDIGMFLGLGTTLAFSTFTDPGTAIAAGEIVHAIAQEIDWDAVMMAV